MLKILKAQVSIQMAKESGLQVSVPVLPGRWRGVAVHP